MAIPRVANGQLRVGGRTFLVGRTPNLLQRTENIRLLSPEEQRAQQKLLTNFSTPRSLLINTSNKNQ